MPTAPQLGLVDHSQNAMPGVQVGGYVNKDYFGAGLGEAAADGGAKIAMTLERNRMIDNEALASMYAREYDAEVSALESRSRTAFKGQDAPKSVEAVKAGTEASLEKFRGLLTDADARRRFDDKALSATLNAQTGITKYSVVETDNWRTGQLDAFAVHSAGESAKARVTSDSPLVHDVADKKMLDAVQASVLHKGGSPEDVARAQQTARGHSTYLEGQHYANEDSSDKLTSLLASPRAKDLSAEQLVDLERRNEGASTRSGGVSAVEAAVASAVKSNPYHPSKAEAQQALVDAHAAGTLNEKQFAHSISYLNSRWPAVEEQIKDRQSIALRTTNEYVDSQRKGKTTWRPPMASPTTDSGQVDQSLALRVYWAKNPDIFKSLTDNQREAAIKYATEGSPLFDSAKALSAAKDYARQGLLDANAAGVREYLSTATWEVLSKQNDQAMKGHNDDAQMVDHSIVMLDKLHGGSVSHASKLYAEISHRVRELSSSGKYTKADINVKIMEEFVPRLKEDAREVVSLTDPQGFATTVNKAYADGEDSIRKLSNDMSFMAAGWPARPASDPLSTVPHVEEAGVALCKGLVNEDGTPFTWKQAQAMALNPAVNQGIITPQRRDVSAMQHVADARKRKDAVRFNLPETPEFVQKVADFLGEWQFGAEQVVGGAARKVGGAIGGQIDKLEKLKAERNAIFNGTYKPE